MKGLLQLIKEAKENRRNVFICGNGGSACNSVHFAEDLLNCGVRARALVDVGFVTAIANDYGYKYIFSKALEILGDENDIIITISASGTSKNIIEVIKKAKVMNIKHYAFPTNSYTKTSTPRTEDLHSKIIHDIYIALK